MKSNRVTIIKYELVVQYAIRLCVGIFFCITGLNKLIYDANFQTMEQTLTEAHIPFPAAMSYLVSILEMVCGALITMNILRIWSSIALIVNMVMAIATVSIHTLPRGLPFHTWLSYFLYLPEFLLILLLLYLSVKAYHIKENRI